MTKIINIEVSKLIGYELNNKIHNEKQIDLLANSIKEYGFNTPIIISKNNIIIAGHGRLEASKKLGLETVPCIVKEDLTDIQIKKYRLLDNKIAELAEDNIENIKLELAEINDIDLNILYSIDLDLGYIDREAIEDDIPDVLTNIIVEKGDIFQLGEHRLMCGDSTSIDDVEKLMDGEKADITFTSPPYNANTKISKGDIFKKRGSVKLYDEGYSDNLKTDEYISFIKDILNNCFLITDGFIFWNVSYNKNSRFEYIKQIEDRLEFLIEQICWKKTSSIPFKGSLMRDWEPIYIFSTNGDSLGLDKVTSNFWEVNNTNCQQENHKACFPIGLPEKALNMLENKNTIFDPFLGSGSTLIASEKTKRKCYGMELDEKYIQVILKRYNTYTNGSKEIKCLNRDLDLSSILGE